MKNHQMLIVGTNVGTLSIWRKRGDHIQFSHEEVLPKQQALSRSRFVPINKEPNDGKT